MAAVPGVGLVAAEAGARMVSLRLQLVDADVVRAAVVAGEDDQRVVGDTVPLQGIEHLAKNVVSLHHQVGVQIVQSAAADPGFVDRQRGVRRSHRQVREERFGGGGATGDVTVGGARERGQELLEASRASPAPADWPDCRRVAAPAGTRRGCRWWRRSRYSSRAANWVHPRRSSSRNPGWSVRRRSCGRTNRATASAAGRLQRDRSRQCDRGAVEAGNPRWPKSANPCPDATCRSRHSGTRDAAAPVDGSGSGSTGAGLSGRGRRHRGWGLVRFAPPGA